MFEVVARISYLSQHGAQKPESRMPTTWTDLLTVCPAHVTWGLQIVRVRIPTPQDSWLIWDERAALCVYFPVKSAIFRCPIIEKFSHMKLACFPECVAKGSRLTLGVWG